MIRLRSPIRRALLTWLPALLGTAVCTGAARAAGPVPLAFGKDWWINPNYAEHGVAADGIFYFIFWLSMAILVGVQAVLVYFMIKYRHRPGCKKAIYSHGNTRLEMIWTLIPAVILIVLALWTKRVWDNYRYSPIADDPNRLQVLVIGEQFKWNVIYPGPRGKIGRYLIYPKTTDVHWPIIPPNKTGQLTFPNMPGPAWLPEEEAKFWITRYITEINPLGRDYSDPDTDPLLPADRKRIDALRANLAARGARVKEIGPHIDDLTAHIEGLEKRMKALKSKAIRTTTEQSQLDKYSKQLASDKKEVEEASREFAKLKIDDKDFESLSQIEALNDHTNTIRPLVIPKLQPVEIQVTSRDVIHDFFLPNFRTRLDTVPGMRGKLYLTALQTSKEVGGGAREYTLAELETEVTKLIGQKDNVTAIVNQESPGAHPPGDMVEGHKDPYWRYAKKNGETIVHNGFPVTQSTIDDLRAAGIPKLTAIVPFYWEIVCEELCGSGHAKMQGKFIVVDDKELHQDEYKNYYPARGNAER